MPASPYGEPQFPVRMSWAESEEQAQEIRELAATDEFTSLGDTIRTLIREALDMRKDTEKADETEAIASGLAEVYTGDDGERRVRSVPVSLARVGDQLARTRPVGDIGEVGRGLSRVQLMAQERGEEPTP